MSQWYRRDGDDLILLLRIQPRAGSLLESSIPIF